MDTPKIAIPTPDPLQHVSGMNLKLRIYSQTCESRIGCAPDAGKMNRHALRRASTTEALSAGCPEEVLRRILGHKDLRVLARYTALQTGDLVRFHDLTGPTRYLSE